MSRNEKVISVSGTLIIFLTVFLFFLLTVDRPVLICSSFGFILWAEAVFFFGLIIIGRITKNTQVIMLRSGIGMIVTAYSVLSVILSVISSNSRMIELKGLWALQASLLVISIITAMVIYQFAIHVRKNTDIVQNDAAEINNIIDRINILKTDDKNKEYALLLTNLADNYRFSDTSTLVQSDRELEKQVTILEAALRESEGADKESIQSIIGSAAVLINKRKIEVRNTKIGKF